MPKVLFHLRKSRFVACRSYKYAFPATSLIETIVALTVITLVITASQSLLRIAVRAGALYEQKTLALNLAENAFSCLQNIRDTNYLRFSSDPDNCWNKINVANVSECSNGTADEITEGVIYYLTENLTNTSSPLFTCALAELSSSEDARLISYEVDFDSDGTADFPYYAREGITDSHFTATDGLDFYQTVDMEYTADGKAYVATVTVSWEHFGTEKSVIESELIEHIY